MKKSIKFAAWSGIISIVIMVALWSIEFIFSFFSSDIIEILPYEMASSLLFNISGIFSIFFIYGFLVLGKKFDMTLLKVMSWIGIISGIIIILASFSLTLASPFMETELENLIVSDSSFEDNSESDIYSWENDLVKEQEDHWEKMGTVFSLLTIAILFSAAFWILFGISVFKLKAKIKSSKFMGILGIITGGLLTIAFILFIPFLISRVWILIYMMYLPFFNIIWFPIILTSFATYILGIIVLFSASTKYERNN